MDAAPLAKVGGGALIVGLAYFLALPRIPVEISRARHLNGSWRDGQFQQLSWALGEHARILDVAVANSHLPPRWTLEEFRRSFEQEWGDKERDRLLMNLVTGEPLREEATPGNLLFRPTARGTEVLWHDVDCVEHLLATLPTRAP